jgi:hypothetical protein
MARKLMTAIGLILVIVLGVLQVADAQAARPPEVHLKCDHGTAGCAGMSGELATADGSTIESVAIVVRDAATGNVVTVTSAGCEVAAREDVPHIVRIECMIDAAVLGFDGDITWSVVLNGVAVWTSPVTPSRCTPPPTTTPPTPGGEVPPETTTTTTTTVAAATTTLPPSPTTTPPAEQPVTDTTVVTAASSTTGPPADTTTTTVVTLVSPASSEPPGDTAAPTEEILPVTGVSLGVIGGIGVMLLLIGMALEVRTRPGGA